MRTIVLWGDAFTDVAAVAVMQICKNLGKDGGGRVCILDERGTLTELIKARPMSYFDDKVEIDMDFWLNDAKDDDVKIVCAYDRDVSLGDDAEFFCISSYNWEIFAQTARFKCSDRVNYFVRNISNEELDYMRTWFNGFFRESIGIPYANMDDAAFNLFRGCTGDYEVYEYGFSAPMLSLMNKIIG